VSEDPTDVPSWTPGRAPDDAPVWDQDEADGLVGLYVLVGVTSLKADGETVVSQAQYHGRIISADSKAGFMVEREGKCKGHPMGLPPLLGVFKPAKPGNYTLRSTGEIVKDPDLLASWTVIERATS
jgi:hypothetical protein